jgi:hypothetical protein
MGGEGGPPPGAQAPVAADACGRDADACWRDADAGGRPRASSRPPDAAPLATRPRACTAGPGWTPEEARVETEVGQDADLGGVAAP